MGQTTDRPLSLLSGAGAAPEAPPAAQPAASSRSNDYWTAKSQSRVQPLICAVWTLGALGSLGLVRRWAAHRSMPPAEWGFGFWMCLCLLLLVHVAIHELGHAAVAWAMYYRVRVISIGPFAFSRDRYGFHWAFDSKCLFHPGGYMGSVATSPDNARLKHIAVIAAGPVASVIAGLVFALATVLLPGSSLQSYWWLTANGAAIGILFGVLSLTPAGYSDGSMLYHLWFRTAAGGILLSNQGWAVDQEQAVAEHDRANFLKEAEIKRGMLDSALEWGPANSMAIAASHEALGHALLAAEDWHAADAELNRAAAFEAELRSNLVLAANVWSGLVFARSQRGRAVEARQAYTMAVAAIRRRKQSRDPAQHGLACAMLSQIHVRTAHWEEALQEASEGLKTVRLTPERLIFYANLFTRQAEAYLNSGEADQGLSAATAAAETLRSSAMPADQRNLAANGLGQLGDALWRAGQTNSSIEYMREAVRRLEEEGAALAAAPYRIRLCTMLRGLGRFTEAVRSLPQEAGLTPHLRRALLAETIELALAAEAADAALENSRTLMDAWIAETAECELERATAEGLLARAYLAGGNVAEAETVARNAAAVLETVQHPEAARCWVTVAAARQRSTGTWPSEIIAHARRVIESAELLTGAEKARWLALPGMDSGKVQQASGLSAGA